MFRITLDHVHDRVLIHEGEESLMLRVDGKAQKMVLELSEAQKALNGISDASDESEKKAAAVGFSNAIFGKEQTEKLLQFYTGDYIAMIDICGRYFVSRLSKIIAKAQKRSAK